MWKKAKQNPPEYLIPPKWLPPARHPTKCSTFDDPRFKVPGRDFYWNLELQTHHKSEPDARPLISKPSQSVLSVLTMSLLDWAIKFERSFDSLPELAHPSHEYFMDHRVV